jgi:hypothetical protein
MKFGIKILAHINTLSLCVFYIPFYLLVNTINFIVNDQQAMCVCLMQCFIHSLVLYPISKQAQDEINGGWLV